MIERVEQGGSEGKRGKEAHIACREQNRKSDTGKDQSNVFDGGVSQQALHVGLDAGKDGSEQSREEPQREHCYSPLPKLNVKQIEANSQHAVDRRLEHDAAHHG